MRTKIAIFITIIVALLSTSAICSDGTRHTKSGYIGAISEAYLDKGLDCIYHKDQAALVKLVMAGAVFPLKAGVKIYLVDVKMFAGKVKVRPAGEVAEFWTTIEAISD